MVVEAGSCDIRQPCCMRRIESIVSCIENGSAKEIRMESTISTKDLKAKLDRKEGISVVETLAPERYREAHIPGALNIPPERIKELARSCCPTKTPRSSPTVRTSIDTPANTLPVNWRRWVTQTWRTIPKVSRAGWKLGFRSIRLPSPSLSSVVSDPSHGLWRCGSDLTSPTFCWILRRNER